MLIKCVLCFSDTLYAITLIIGICSDFFRFTNISFFQQHEKRRICNAAESAQSLSNPRIAAVFFRDAMQFALLYAVFIFEFSLILLLANRNKSYVISLFTPQKVPAKLISWYFCYCCLFITNSNLEQRFVVFMAGQTYY